MSKVQGPGSLGPRLWTLNLGLWTLDPLSRDFNRFQQPTSFIERLLVFAGGHAVGDDSRAGLNIGFISLDDERAECDASVHVARVIDAADCAGIRAAAVRLQF